MAKTLKWLPSLLTLIVVGGIATPFWLLKGAAIVILVFTLLFYLDSIPGLNRQKVALIYGLALIPGLAFVTLSDEKLMTIPLSALGSLAVPLGLLLGFVLLMDVLLIAATPVYLAYKTDEILEKHGYRKPWDFSWLKTVSYICVIPAVFWLMSFSNSYFLPAFPFLRDLELLIAANSVMFYIFVSQGWILPLQATPASD